MMEIQSLVIVILCIAKLSFAQTNPRVTTPLGIIEGTVAYTYTGNSFYQFKGIPYATPPVGELRYENPQDPQNWTGILMANESTICYQYSNTLEATGNYKIVGVEDCLYYNVFTPTLNESAKLDVLIHIHGGAFMYGSGAGWGPELILNHRLVYVNINYRVGPLGFLSTEDNVLPGNLGIRDQQQALRWIKNNIKYFGGNSESITIHGLSAGSASVQLHYILPGSKGLFHKGIAQSGTVLNNWVLMEKPLEKTKKLAALVGCPTDSSINMKTCLKSISAGLIVEKVKEFQPFLYNPFSPWAVVVDGNWASDPVLPRHPLEQLRTKQIHDAPLLMSYVTSEGLYPGADFYARDEDLEAIDTRWNELMPHILMYNYTVDNELKDEVSRAIRQKYLKGQPLNRNQTYFDLIQAIGDRCFVADLEKGLKLHSAGMESPVYSYVFNYRGNKSVTQTSAGNINLGVSHADDTIYILHKPLYSYPDTPDDIAMSNLLLDMTMSFVYQGAPNISSQWMPLSKNVQDRLNLLKINRYDDLVPLQEEHIGESLFWDSLPIIENEKLLDINLGLALGPSIFNIFLGLIVLSACKF